MPVYIGFDAAGAGWSPHGLLVYFVLLLGEPENCWE
jgi:hypothetical protein